MDEPTAGLDPEERIRFRNLLSEFSGKRTVLLSTYIVEDVAQTSQNLAIIRSGLVLFQGTIAQMLQETRGNVWMITTDGSSLQIETLVLLIFVCYEQDWTRFASFRQRCLAFPGSSQTGIAIAAKNDLCLLDSAWNTFGV
ncbi:hypothetical protein KDA_67080 [Dictyobacter alpinus]|uniref:ATPase AAA-type core domain-containing protein n=1 Tax=Dictyobacter alpinus TaxID=2014873 RepID=A0A402BIK1_9CHLR|nr:hypothetical protein KDA_67080 [Dictyobacter alpinus]